MAAFQIKYDGVMQQVHMGAAILDGHVTCQSIQLGCMVRTMDSEIKWA